MVEVRKISSAKKATNGTSVKSKSEQTTYTKTVVPGSHQFVIIHGPEGKKSSITKHCTEAQAESFAKTFR